MKQLAFLRIEVTRFVSEKGSFCNVLIAAGSNKQIIARLFLSSKSYSLNTE